MTTVDRFLATWSILREQAGWLEPSRAASATQAALLVLAGAEHRAHELPGALQELKDSSGMLSGLRGAMGQSLVAVAVMRGVRAGALPEREKALRARFKALGLPAAPGLWPVSAAAWLGLHGDQEVERALPRMVAIMERWKQDHPWLTGQDDLHSAALHAVTGVDVESIGVRTEARYKALGAVGFGLALNVRQRAAQLTALNPDVSAETLNDRVRALEVRFKEQGRHTWFRTPEPLALLALVDGDPRTLGTALHNTLAVLDQELTSTDLSLRYLLAAALVAGEYQPDGQLPLEGALLAMVVSAVLAQYAVSTAAA